MTYLFSESGEKSMDPLRLPSLPLMMNRSNQTKKMWLRKEGLLVFSSETDLASA